MEKAIWDPALYLRFPGERTGPVRDLAHRLKDAQSPIHRALREKSPPSRDGEQQILSISEQLQKYANFSWTHRRF